MIKIIAFIKKDIILFIAAVFAFVSMIFVPPGIQYLSYIDYSVPVILFCLMIVVAGVKKLGVFDFLSQKLLAKTKSVKFLTVLLVNCVFVSSMLVTNDVALITFIPITIRLFALSGRKKLIFAVVMETLAANLGSMLTPFGNPQNLYIYSFYRLNMLSFFKYVLPVGAIGYIVIIGLILVSQNGCMEFSLEQKTGPADIKKPLFYYAGLFLLCVTAVMHILDFRICLIIILAATLIVDRKLLKEADYGLLLTFVCFFVFVGNLERIDAVKNALSFFLHGRVFLVSVLSSQVISNVPAAIMISHFTTDVRQILLGVNIGGLGTPVASLASLISFKLYSGSEGSAPGKFLGAFTIYNISILLLLSAIFLF